MTGSTWSHPHPYPPRWRPWARLMPHWMVSIAACRHPMPIPAVWCIMVMWLLTICRLSAPPSVLPLLISMVLPRAMCLLLIGQLHIALSKTVMWFWQTSTISLLQMRIWRQRRKTTRDKLWRFVVWLSSIWPSSSAILTLMIMVPLSVQASWLLSWIRAICLSAVLWLNAMTRSWKTWRLA